MYECLIREHEIKTIPVYTVADAVNKIKVQQDKKRKRKEDRDEQDNANSDNKLSKSKQDPTNLYVSKTPNEIKGHTSYLTFATFLPVLDDENKIFL